MSLGDPRGWGRGPSLLFLPFPPRSAEEHRLATTGGSFIPPFRTPLRRGRLEEDAAVHDGKSCFPPTEPGAGESRFCSEPCADTDGHQTSCLFSSHSSYPLLPPQDWGLGALGVSHSSSSSRILRPSPPTTTHTPPGPGPVLTFRVPGLTLGVLRPPPGLGPRPGSTVSAARVLGRSCSATWWLC